MSHISRSNLSFASASMPLQCLVVVEARDWTGRPSHPSKAYCRPPYAEMKAFESNRPLEFWFFIQLSAIKRNLKLSQWIGPSIVFERRPTAAIVIWPHSKRMQQMRGNLRFKKYFSFFGGRPFHHTKDQSGFFVGVSSHARDLCREVPPSGCGEPPERLQSRGLERPLRTEAEAFLGARPE